MITDEQARWIALFFLFAFMDEKTALQAAHRAVAHLKATAGRRDTDQPISRVALIKAIRKMFDLHRKSSLKNRNAKSILPPETSWMLSEHVDIATWVKFQKDVSESEVVAVTLSKILSFSDHEIAEGLNISIGTARYRVGKGIRQLGMIFEKTGRVRA